MQAQKIQVSNLKEQIGASRLQTGTLKVNSDHTGVFINNDDCVQLWMSLALALEAMPQDGDGSLIFARRTLENLQEAMKPVVKPSNLSVK